MSAVIVPNGWKFGFLSEFIQINPSVKIDKNTFYPFIEMDAVPFDGKKASYINMRLGSEAGMKFKRFDTLLARITPSAENGKAMYITDNIDIGIGSTEFIVFRAKKDVTESVYVFYLVTSDLVRPKSIALMEGTSGRQRIPNSIYTDKIKILLPSDIVEQQKIATILSTLDRTIEATQKLIDKEKMVKKGLMADLLTHGIDEQGRIRSPQTHTYVESPLEMIPQGWEVKMLGKLVDIVGGGTPARDVDDYWKKGSIPWVTVKDLHNKLEISDSEEKITEFGLKNSAANLIPPQNIITPTRMSIGRFFINSVPITINQDLKALKPKKTVFPLFLLWNLLQYGTKLEALGTGTTVKGITLPDLKNLQLPVPPLPEQQKIATILSAQDRKIETEETNLAKLQNLKKGLMGDLLSGKVRV